jgi:anti-anti-sigma regulatory factor
MTSQPPDKIAHDERLFEALARAEQALETERKLRREADGMLAGLRRVAGAGALEKMDAETLAASKDVFDCRDAALLVEEGEGTFVVVATSSPVFAGTRWSSNALFRRVLAGQPVAVFDVRDVAEWSVQSPAVQALAGSALHIPLITRRRRAILIATHDKRASFSPRHVELARRFTTMVVAFIEGAYATKLESERHAAEERAALLEAQRATLEAQLETIRHQQREIGRLAAPVIPLWPGILLVPFVGSLDAAQAAAATERILNEIASQGAEVVVFDLTGLHDADVELATRLESMMRSVKLMGGKCQLCGVGAGMSPLLSDLGALRSARIFRTLGDALGNTLRSAHG